jgi:ATP-dependent Lhr-like helicase
VVGELGASALFGARFRENAGRALLLPRAYPGKRTPLWQQRLKSQNLLEVAKRYAEFPIILETYRECLRDVLDVPGLSELLRKLHSRELSVVEVETPSASPFASSLLFDYVASYMYEGDTPNAERRAAALSLDRDLLRELLGQEELRDLIDPTRSRGRERPATALRAHAGRLRRRAARRAPTGRRPHRGRGGIRVAPGAGPPAEMLATLAGERRAARLRINGEPRWVAAEDAGLYRDALGAVPPSGLPEAFVADVPGRAGTPRAPLRAHPRPVHLRRAQARYGIDLTPVLAGLEREGDLMRGSSDPGEPSASGATPRCCAGCGAPRWPRCARRSSRPTSGRSPASPRAGRAWTATRRAAPGSTGCARR